MKIHFKNILFAALLFIAACKKDSTKNAGVVTSGSAVFTTYIVAGDSQTAGYADDGLYNTGIQNSYPAILAGQMSAAGGGTFNQPLFPADQANGTGYLKISGYNTAGLPVLTRTNTNLALRGSYNGLPLYTKYSGANNNLGVAGIRVSDINDPQYGNANSYFERMLPANAPANITTYIDFVTANPFTFFTCNLGSNDVFYYAYTGGRDVSLLTDPTLFSQNYSLIINKLTAKGAKGILTNIPDFTSIPFFTTIKVDSVLKGLKKIVPAYNTLYISARVSAAQATTGYATRAATADDKILLTFDPTKIGTLVSTSWGMLPYGLTSSTPIESTYILDVNEAALVKSYTAQFNAIIAAAASTKGLALFDAKSYFDNLVKGITINNTAVSFTYLTGGMFSLDGIHLTPRGNAVIANQNILTINAKYGSTLQTVDISKYSGANIAQ